MARPQSAVVTFDRAPTRGSMSGGWTRSQACGFSSRMLEALNHCRVDDTTRIDTTGWLKGIGIAVKWLTDSEPAPVPGVCETGISRARISARLLSPPAVPDVETWLTRPCGFS